MATLTDGKGNVLELGLGSRGITAISHTNDGASTTTTYPLKASLDFMGALFGEYAEVLTPWMNQIAPTSPPRSRDTLPTTSQTPTPPETSGPTIG